jgi:hypothetical protein
LIFGVHRLNKSNYCFEIAKDLGQISQFVMPNTVSNGAKALPKSHRAAVYDRPGSISTKIVDLETPEPGVGEVLIKL